MIEDTEGTGTASDDRNKKREGTPDDLLHMALGMIEFEVL